MSPVEGASPWEVGQVPSVKETLRDNATLGEAVGTTAATIAGAKTGAFVGSPLGVPGIAAGSIIGGGLGYVASKRAGRAALDIPQEPLEKDAAIGLGFGALPYGASVAAQGIKMASGKAAMRLYESAAKYPSTLKVAEKTRITLAGLRERIMFNDKSLERLGNLNDELVNVADEAMVYAQMRGEGVATKGIKDSFLKVTNKMKADPVFGKKTAEGLQDAFAGRFNELPEYMTPQELLAWRRSLNGELAGYFDRAKKAGLIGNESSIRKTMLGVRGAVQEEMFKMVPELKAVGQRHKDIIDLLTYTERATSRISNWDLVGLGSLVAGDIAADAAGINPQTKLGALGMGAAGMLAWRMAGNPNTKARIAFGLAKVGRLSSASPSTLELLQLSREGARNLQPKMKALPFPRSLPAMPKPSSASYVGETVNAENVPDVYEKLWVQYADESAQLAQGGQYPVIPKAPKRNLYGPEEWLPPKTSADLERQTESYGMDVYDRIRRGYLGDTLTGLPPKPQYLGAPYEELERGLVYKGKRLR
jgi:hypothetical protein